MYKSLRLLLLMLLGLDLGASAQTINFPTPGGPYAYTVGTGVTGITVNVRGARGGQNSDPGTTDPGGSGGCVQAVITVTPGQVLQVYVGGCGVIGTSTTGGAGGINGGGDGSHGISIYSGGGGGGASDIRTGAGADIDRIVVGAGGGGAGYFCGGAERGGHGGAAVGEAGSGCGVYTGGGGGDWAASVGGDPGSCGGCIGFIGTGGGYTDGGDGGTGSAGGGGGGGYYGGGGGWWTGGGGGANWDGGAGVTPISNIRGCNPGCGSVAITVSCVAGVITGGDVVCVGSTTTLSNTTGGGTWISGAPGIATISSGGVVTGVNAGTAIITYQLLPGTPGCRAIKEITVNPLPAPIVTDSVLCDSSTVTLTSASPGGVWSTSNPAVGTVSLTGDVTGITPGFVVISYTLSTGCTATRSMTINPLPAPIVGPSAVCLGSGILLTDATPGGTWSWTTVSGGGAITLFAGNVNGTSPGVVDVCYTNGLGCTICHVVTVNPLPGTITGSGQACVGVPTTYSSVDLGGTWSNAPTAVGTIDPSTGVFTPDPVVTGTTTITYTLPTGCFRIRTITVNALPAPIVGLTALCDGSTITLTNASGTSTWSSSNPAVATVGASTGVVTGVGVAGGVVTITFTLGSTCYVTHTVTVNPRPDTILGPDPICEGSCATYTTTSTTGVWSSTLPLIGTIDAFTGIYCAIAPGSGMIRYTLPTGCMRQKAINVDPLPAAILGPSTVCVGSTIVLSSGTGGGTWYSPDEPLIITTSGTLVVRGESAGVATVSYTLPTTCQVTKLVTVYPAPGPVYSPGLVTELCALDTTTLYNDSTGGTWSSSLTPVGTIDPVTGLVTGIGGGVVTFTYTRGNGCFATYTMTILSLPSTITGPDNMCISDPPVTVSSGGGAGTWSSGPPAGIVSVAAGPGATGDVSAIAIGSTVICYTFSTPSACRICETFTVHPVPAPITGPGTVCVGRTITLSSTTGGGTWTSPNTPPLNATVGAGTGIVTGVLPGVDTIVYTIGTGCSVSRIVNVLTSPATITGSLNVCVGLTTVLSNTTAGGVWTTSDAVVAPISPAAPVVSLSTTVTGGAAGTAVIEYTLPNGCFSDVTVSVNSTLAPIAGPRAVCQGSTITLTVTGTPAGTWSSGTPAVATVTPGPSLTTTVSGILPGTSLITFTSPSGCGLSAIITVNPTPAPVITPLGSTNLCPGDVVALTATTGVGYTYQWRNLAGNIPGATNSTFLTGLANTYRVVVTLGACSFTSPFVVVTMNPVIASITPFGPVINTCASTPPTLTAAPSGAGITYQWMLGGLPIAGEVASTHTATVTGVYSAIVTNSFGCSGTSNSVTVNLVPAPTATITLSGPLTFCAGGSVTMTADAGTGYTYQWYFNGLPIAGATNISHTATLGGNYQVIVNNLLSCSTTSAVVAVVATPGPPAAVTVGGGGTLLCAGTATLLFVTPGPYDYQWYKNSVLIPGATTASYNVTTTGSYTLVVFDPLTGCSTTSIPEVVTVIPIPIINPLSATSFCWGGSVNLTVMIAPGAGTVTYQWIKNGIDIPGANLSNYVATTSGLYSVRVTIGGGVCNMTTLATTVTQYPLPNPLVTFDGTFLHTGTTFVTYQWYKGGTPIAGATTAHCHHLGVGSYKVIVTDINSCQSSSASYVITTPPISGITTGVENISGSDIKIFPNPAQNTLHIEYAEPVRAVISSMDGRTVIDRDATNEVDLSGLADGVYMIKLYDKNGQMLKTEKLVKAAQ